MSETLNEVGTFTEEELHDYVELLVESRTADLQLALDDVGWKPLGGDSIEDQQELSLDTIKAQADIARSLAIINPLVKHGLNVRTQYIMGKGIKFLPKSGDKLDAATQKILDNPKNQKYLFSAEAYNELERCLGTDGNFFFLAQGKAQERQRRGVKQATGQRIPFAQITGYVSNPEDREDVWFYKRQYKRKEWSEREQRFIEDEVNEYIPSDLYDGNIPNQINKVPVRKDAVLIEHSVNKQVGWVWGLPDSMPIIWWAKAHKEFLEDCAKLIKAYSRFAWKATAASPKGVKATAAAVRAQPSRGLFGEKQDIGGTAVMSEGANLQPLGRTAGSVDFSAGLPLANYIAAGLEIPLTDLLSDSSLSNRSAAETLGESKLAAMTARQKSWSRFYERLFTYWGREVKVEFDAIEKESVFKQIQGIQAASSLNMLHAEEVRELLCVVLGLDKDKGLPTEEELGLLILDAKKAEEQAKTDAEIAADKAMDPSYSDNTNRDDAGGQHEYSRDHERPDGV